ncbi:unnamed protein product [Boreogadus saida]
MAHKWNATPWRSWSFTSAFLLVCLAPLTQSYNLRKALGRNRENGDEGKILFGNFFEKGRTDLPTSVHVNWNVTSSAEDAIGYQKDSSGWFPDDPSVQWKHLELSVRCGAYQMKLVAREPEASQLQLVQKNAKSLPLTQLPETCGYSISRNNVMLVMVASYDGCTMMQEDGRYILPMLWQRRQIMLTCPIKEMHPAPPMSPKPAALPYPYNQWAMRPPFQHYPYGQHVVHQEPAETDPSTTQEPTTTPPTPPKELPAKMSPKPANLRYPYNQWLMMPPFNYYPYGQHVVHQEPAETDPSTTQEPTTTPPTPPKELPAKMSPKPAALPYPYNQWAMIPPFNYYPYGQHVVHQEPAETDPSTTQEPTTTPPTPPKELPAKMSPKPAALPYPYNQWAMMPPFNYYPYGQHVVYPYYMQARNPSTNVQTGGDPGVSSYPYNQWAMKPPFQHYPYGQHVVYPYYMQARNPSTNVPTGGVPGVSSYPYNQWAMKPPFQHYPYGQHVVHQEPAETLLSTTPELTPPPTTPEPTTTPPAPTTTPTTPAPTTTPTTTAPTATPVPMATHPSPASPKQPKAVQSEQWSRLLSGFKIPPWSIKKPSPIDPKTANFEHYPQQFNGPQLYNPPGFYRQP